jgi:site-specific DNA recombinase
VTGAVRRHLDGRKSGKQAVPTDDRALIEEFVDRVVIKLDEIEIHLTSRRQGGRADAGGKSRSRKRKPVVITMPFTAPSQTAAKRIIHSPQPTAMMSVDKQDALLTAIAKARAWVDDLIVGRATLNDIAEREGKVERHIRLLAPLAFAPPKLIGEIADGAMAQVTVTGLAKRMPYNWAQQLALG